MIGRQSVVGLIPARAGSRGIPGKNMIDVHGKPLIQWTIDSARKCRYLDRILVSTDDPEVKSTAAGQGVAVLDRPSAISGDSATAAQVIEHALDMSITEDLLVYLQPTSPLRQATDIEASLDLLMNTVAEAVVSVTPVLEHPEWMYRVRAHDHLLAPVLRNSSISRRQDLPKTVRLNGAIYCSASSKLRPDGDFFRLTLCGYVMPSDRSLDIDTFEELELFRNAFTRRPN